MLNQAFEARVLLRDKKHKPSKEIKNTSPQWSKEINTNPAKEINRNTNPAKMENGNHAWRRLQAVARIEPRWLWRLELNEEQRGLFWVWFRFGWCGEWRTKGSVLGVWFGFVNLENEERRKKNGSVDLENEERRKKRKNSRSTRKEIKCVKLDFHYQHIDLKSLRLELLQ